MSRDHVTGGRGEFSCQLSVLGCGRVLVCGLVFASGFKEVRVSRVMAGEHWLRQSHWVFLGPRLLGTIDTMGQLPTSTAPLPPQ
jgi:hypothetical protein